jgi:hypothetical protein
MRNISVSGVHMHNNGVRGLRSIDKVQRNFVGAHVMWVNVAV